MGSPLGWWVAGGEGSVGRADRPKANDRENPHFPFFRPETEKGSRPKG